MKFFLDENFPRKATEALRNLGHTVIDIRGTGAEGIDDQVIFEIAQKEKAVFLTTDRDFFHTIPFLYKHHFGIIVIALSSPNAVRILEKLTIALSFIDNHPIESNCLLLTDRRINFMQCPDTF
jgi:predicted nuclease of predicted toxin-antitoxin system